MRDERLGLHRADPLVGRHLADVDGDVRPTWDRLPPAGGVAAATVRDLDLPLDVRTVVESPRLCAAVQPRAHYAIPFLRAAMIAATWSGTGARVRPAVATGSRTSNHSASSPITACRMSSGSVPAS